MHRLKNLAITLLLVITLITIFQNTDDVAVRFLLAKATIPLVLVLLMTFLIGLATGYLGATLRHKGRHDEKESDEDSGRT